MISLENLTKQYGKFTAVENLSLEIGKGEVFGFLGPNGAGKTTTIKMMCGLISITNGRACIDGLCITADPVEYKRKFALIPDNPYMFEKLRGIEYIEFVANLYRVPKETFDKNLEKYLDVFNASGFVNDFIESYSHGMRQKLLLTASMMHDPDVMILDEPMVGLDPKSKKILVGEIKRLSKEGMTIFMSTHSIETAEEACTSIGIIDKGHLVKTGTMDELKKSNEPARLEEIFFKLTEEEKDIK